MELTTDFGGGAALPANTQCRIAVTARVIASNVSRTIHAIVDRNLLAGPDNPTFNNPLTAGLTPSGWTGINPADAFAPNGGPDGTAPNCRRSAWTAKQKPPAARQATAQTRRAIHSDRGVGYQHHFPPPGHHPARRLPPRPTFPVPAPRSRARARPRMTVRSAFVLIGTGGAGTWTVASNAPTAGARRRRRLPIPVQSLSDQLPSWLSDQGQPQPADDRRDRPSTPSNTTCRCRPTGERNCSSATSR